MLGREQIGGAPGLAALHIVANAAVLRLAGFVAILSIAAPASIGLLAAQAQDLKNFDYTIRPHGTSELYDADPDRVKPCTPCRETLEPALPGGVIQLQGGPPRASEIRLSAVANNIVWPVHYPLMTCDNSLALVYRPGTVKTETVKCGPKRIGTDTSFWNQSYDATYRTTARVVSGALVLTGKMKGVEVSAGASCRSAYKFTVQFEIDQYIKATFNGPNCKIAEFREVYTYTDTRDYGAGPVKRKQHVVTLQLAPGASCDATPRKPPAPEVSQQTLDVKCD